jgi:DEAD/DEAH box helicase domain-containing protein
MTPDVSEYIKSLNESPKFGPQVVSHKIIPSVEPSFATRAPDIASPIRELLQKLGIDNLYTHQQKALSFVQEGKDILVATPTASGKSMIYNLPVLNDLFTSDPGHSLYLFPLKALARDQFNILTELFVSLPHSVTRRYEKIAALFDGDTTSYMRRKIRNAPPPVILTNPDMLHLSILPYHDSWMQFFKKLRFVVIDEVHSYRGVFGSHMAWVLRRLQRIAALYGSHPQFILLSATIGNPDELGRLLIGRKVHVIDKSGAPRAEKNMVLLNPWDSAAYTASQLLEAAVKRGIRTIVYTQSRKMTELINLWTSPRLGKLGSKLSSYRAGFLPEERHEIEKQLFTGDLLGVISTSALELGIDIGDLHLCILVGYPGSIVATWQRGGRVGRSNQKSAIIMIAQEDALDQYFMRTPDDFYRRAPEAAVLNPQNSVIMDQHLHCCAAEIPINQDEPLLKDPIIQQQIATLSMQGVLLEIGSGGQWLPSRKYPQRWINLRGGGSQATIINSENGEIIGNIDSGRALKECHPGAVYIHRGNTWVVELLDLIGKEVVVRREKPNYFTRPMTQKKTEILELVEKKMSFGIFVSFGRVKVTEKITGFQKRNSVTHNLISTTPLDLPDQVIETEGMWVDLPETIRILFEKNKYHFMGAIHAMEHAMIALFPLLVLCDRNDIGGIAYPFHVQTESASVFIYDGCPGGVGLSREAFVKSDQLLLQARKTVNACGCDNGCPSCVHSPKCGSGNRPIDKNGCLVLLEEVLKIIPAATKIEEVRVRGIINQKNHNPSIAVPELRGIDALPSRFGVFDLETIRSAEEVGGWNKCEKMGVSVGIVFDSQLGDCVTYLEQDIQDLIEHLQNLDLVVGFNNKRFDNRVLSGYTNANLSKLPTLDLLEEVHNHLGYRLSLNRLAQTTLGVEKTADGLQALKWYKEGKIDLIQQYCRRDVEITRDLLFHGLEKEYFLFTNKAKQKVRLPLALDAIIGKILAA